MEAFPWSSFALRHTHLPTHSRDLHLVVKPHTPPQASTAEDLGSVRRGRARHNDRLSKGTSHFPTGVSTVPADKPLQCLLVLSTRREPLGAWEGPAPIVLSPYWSELSVVCGSAPCFPSLPLAPPKTLSMISAVKFHFPQA